MKKLYIVRHGQSEGNIIRHVSFQHTPITEQGRSDSYKLGKRLKRDNIKVDAIFYSPLTRSVQTLEAIKEGGFDVSQIQVEPNPLLQEINRKEFEGKPSEEYYAKCTESGLPTNDYRCNGGESENDVTKRAMKFLNYFNNSEFNSVLIVTHGHFINCFMKLLGFSDLGHLHGASLSLITIDGENAKIVFLDDASHL